MRKFMLVCITMLLAIAAPAFGQTTHKWVLPSKAATTAKANAHRTVFASREEAKAAYDAKEFDYYTPLYVGMWKNELPDGKTRKAFPLERDTIVEMLTFGNRFGWVILKEKTLCRYNLFPDGSPFSAPYALDACGNPIRAIAYPDARLPQPSPQAKASSDPVTVEAPAPQVIVHVPAPQVTIVPAPPVIVQAPAPKVTVQPQAPAPLYGPMRQSVLPAPRTYGPRPEFNEPMQPMVPEVHKLHWGWKVLGGLVLGYAVYKALDHKKDPAPQRAVVTDPPSAGGYVVAHW